MKLEAKMSKLTYLDMQTSDCNNESTDQRWAAVLQHFLCPLWLPYLFKKNGELVSV